MTPIANLPTNHARLLKRASEFVAQATSRASDALDDYIVEAVMLATCAQVEFWMVSDESVTVLGNVESTSVGGFSVTFKEGTNVTICTRAKAFLREAGLLYRGRKVRGGVCLEDSVVYVEPGGVS